MRVFVAVILGLCLSQAEAYTVAETCGIVQSNTFIADPLDCNSYYYCVNGVVSFHDSCPKGFVYNAFTGACDYPSNYNCPFNTKEVCKGLSLVYLPDPLDCSSYIYCDAKSNAAYGSCGDQIYNEDTNSCTYPDTGSSCSGQKCALVPNNRFVAGNDKFTSLTCFQGVGYENSCNPNGGQNFVYNAIKGECEPAPVETENVNALCAALTNAQQFAASTIDCNAYYFCTALSAEPPVVTVRTGTKLYCPQRFHFDQVNQNCALSWDFKPTNGCNRCGGYPAGTFVGTSNNCQGYEYCTGKNETPNDKALCPNNFPFFDEKSQTCVKANPALNYCA